MTWGLFDTFEFSGEGFFVSYFLARFGFSMSVEPCAGGWAITRKGRRLFRAGKCNSVFFRLNCRGGGVGQPVHGLANYEGAVWLQKYLF